MEVSQTKTESLNESLKESSEKYLPNSIKIKHDFYQDYLSSVNFSKIFDIRKKYIRDKFSFLGSDEELITEYFVEIFSWTVIPKNILLEIDEILADTDILSNNGKKLTLIDPCSGNSFHSFLFQEFCERPSVAVDIQPEKNPWMETISMEGVKYLNSIDMHQDKILLLSWIDYDELAHRLVKNYKGNIIISVGNYENISFKYLKELHQNFIKIKNYDFIMPWNHEERLKIFVRR